MRRTYPPGMVDRNSPRRFPSCFTDGLLLVAAAAAMLRCGGTSTAREPAALSATPATSARVLSASATSAANAANANGAEGGAPLSNAGAPLAGPLRLSSGARFVPEQWRLPTDAGTLGVEPGGAVRAFAGSLRVLLLPGGAIQAAETTFPAHPDVSIALPDRLGGGFAFVSAMTVWRSDRWLGDVRPLVRAGQAITSLEPGMDRLYIHLHDGSRAAIDAMTGKPLATGLPLGSTITAYAALDGWRAAAIVDLRGLVATHDAGATWQPIDVPILPRRLFVDAGALVVSGEEASSPRTHDFAIGDGTDPERVVPRDRTPEAHAASFDGSDVANGERPLSMAIEDGWPLGDGTALLLRDGHLQRVRLDDGARVESWEPKVTYAATRGGGVTGSGEVDTKANPLPARCHPLALGTVGTVATRAELGFVCGDTSTTVLRYDETSRSLALFGHFAGARAVSATGNGAIVVRGSCQGAADVPHVNCIFAPAPAPATATATASASWRELRIAGAADGERVIPLKNGSIAVLSPARGDLTRMRLTLLEGSNVRTVALRPHAAKAQPNAPIDRAVAAVLRDGIWLDGVQESGPNELSAWVDARGSVLGLRIRLDGDTTYGAWVRDLGSPMVSGLYGFGLTAAHRGYETIDGGLTWTAFEAPSPLVLPRELTHRACGPVGCNGGGWLRVGWGSRRDDADDALGARSAQVDRSTSTAPIPTMLIPPDEAAALHVAQPMALQCRQTETDSIETLARQTQQARTATQLAAIRLSLASPHPPSSLVSASELPRFLDAPLPPLRSTEKGFALGVLAWRDRSSATLDAARIYAWGPSAGDWNDSLDDAAGVAPGDRARWLVRWSWPFGAASDVRSTASALAPDSVAESSHVAPAAPLSGSSFALVAGDDAGHALLVGSRNNRTNAEIYELEEGRAPLRVVDERGGALPDVDAAVRAGGHWYFASSVTAGSGGSASASGTSPFFSAPMPPLAAGVPQAAGGGNGSATQGGVFTSIWASERGVARVIARVPRFGGDGRTFAARLARRADNRSIALVVDGDPIPNRSVARRFALPIDLESGARGDVVSLGLADLSDRSTVAPCDAVAPTGGADAWLVDVPLPQGVALHFDAAPGVPDVGFSPSLARLRFTDEGHAVCAVHVAAFGAALPQAAGHGALARAPSSSAFPVVIHGRTTRTTFSCVPATPVPSPAARR